MSVPGLGELKKYGPMLLVMLCGIVLLLSAGGAKRSDTETAHATEAELRLQSALEAMEGVGPTCVLLAEKPGREEGYLGAVIVCPGASDSTVRLKIVETVTAFTGLGSNKIVVQKRIST